MISYLFKMILCSGLLLLAYKLLLEKTKLYRFNRFYLLGSLAFSFLAPIIVIGTAVTEASPELVNYFVVDQLTDQAAAALPLQPPVVETSAWSWNQLIWLIYGIISLLLLLRFVINIARIIGKAGRSPYVQTQGARLVLTGESMPPYSFLHYIFLNAEDHSANTIEKEILQHEMAHVKQRHSWDILAIEMLLALCWFNPFFFLFRRAIRLNHEFLADAAVLRKYQNPRAYQFLLLEKSSRQSFSLASSFNYLTTKKRLIMMTKTSDPLAAALRLALLVPVLGGCVLLFSSSAAVPENPADQPAMARQFILSDTTPKKDSVPRQVFVGEPAGFTKEGASEEQMKEYADIIARYKSDDKPLWKISESITEEDKSRLETIFKQMSREQQNQQHVLFLKPMKPFAKQVPTENQLAGFKNASVYGVWIDEKKVSNSELNKYKNTDFSHYFISKLYRGAKVGKSYTHQLDLMTNAFYEKYRKNALDNKKSVMVVVGRKTKL